MPVWRPARRRFANGAGGGFFSRLRLGRRGKPAPAASLRPLDAPPGGGALQGFRPCFAICHEARSAAQKRAYVNQRPVMKISQFEYDADELQTVSQCMEVTEV